jgi:hypothetical protein
MFSTDDDVAAPTVNAPPLALESDSTAVAATVAADDDNTTGDKPGKRFVRNLNTGEVMEVTWNDPAMLAHTE